MRPTTVFAGSLLVAASFALPAAARSAQAQDQTVEGTDLTIGALIDQLGADRERAAAMIDLRSLAPDARIVILPLGELRELAGEDLAALDAAMADRADMAATLRANLGANAAVLTALEAQGFNVENVVAVHLAADDEVILIVDNRV